MSDELKFSDDLRLPDELAACEARLAGHVLVSSRLDRDELLYRAGWAAAEAKLSLPIPPPSKGWEQPSTGDPKSPERRAVVHSSVAAWSAASAALAAALAVAVTLALQPASAPPIAADGNRSIPPLAASPSKLEPAAVRRMASDSPLTQLDALASRTPLADRFPRAGGLRAMSSLTEFDRWDRPSFVYVSADSEAASPVEQEPATASRLLDEYLPGSARRGAAGAGSRTGVLKLLNPLSWGEDTI